VRVLCLNAGSSSLKVSLVDPDDTVVAEQDFAAPGGHFDDAELGAAVHAMEGVEAVGHRVVHSGPRYITSVRIDADVIGYLLSITDLAPLHMAAALAGIAAVRLLLPRVPGVACFDTAFHAGLPPPAHIYPLPYAWYADWGIRRFGFHGLSVAWSVEQAAALLGRPVGELGLVVAHLGGGCSVTAVRDGHLVTNGGRILNVTALGDSVAAARAAAYDAASHIDFAGVKFRRDIAHA